MKWARKKGEHIIAKEGEKKTSFEGRRGFFPSGRVWKEVYVRCGEGRGEGFVVLGRLLMGEGGMWFLKLFVDIFKRKEKKNLKTVPLVCTHLLLDILPSVDSDFGTFLLNNNWVRPVEWTMSRMYHTKCIFCMSELLKTKVEHKKKKSLFFFASEYVCLFPFQIFLFIVATIFFKQDHKR